MGQSRMPNRTDQQFATLNLSETRATLERLERQEWGRWATALMIILALTLGFFSLLSYGTSHQNLLERAAQSRATWGLLGLVVLFDLFVAYQQVAISRLRRQLSAQIATIATIEALSPLSAQDEAGRRERRRAPRWPLDALLKISRHIGTKDVTTYGRVRDVGTRGLGAVIAEELLSGETVRLKFDLPGHKNFEAEAQVRYRRGFHYGFEFPVISADDSEMIRNSMDTSVAAR